MSERPRSGMTQASEQTTMIASRALAHPIAIFAMALLVMNDHVLKAAYPGLVTGKL